MKLLLDTNVLLQAAGFPDRLSPQIRSRLLDSAAQVFFSSASILEVVIKSSLGRSDFRVDPERLHSGLVEKGYIELAVESEHALAVGRLPQIHRDPFDRILVAQAIVEDAELLTRDQTLGRYPARIRPI